MKRYAIIGFGCAGYSAAKAIRTREKEGEIHVFEATREAPANPMLTTYLASGRITDDAAHPFGSNLEQIGRELGLTVHSGVRVHRVDAARKAVVLTDGKMEFDKLLLATGAQAFCPPLPGLPDRRVMVMRTMADARGLHDYLNSRSVERAVVVGASMVGIKVAELLWRRGIETTVADAAPFLFPLAAFENVARFLEGQVAAQGVRFLWNVAARRVLPHGLELADGTLVKADLICLCIGTRANTKLAENEVVINRAIVVDNHMATSVPGIYAAGDCCEGTELQSGQTMIIGLWANAKKQGETAGVNMVGGDARYEGNILHNITHFMGLDFIGLGDTRRRGKSVSWGDMRRGNYIQAVLGADGKIQCANILGNLTAAGVLKNHMYKELSGEANAFGPVEAALLERSGVPAAFVRQLGGE